MQADADLPHEIDERPQGRREWSGWLRSIVLPVALLAAIVGGLFYYQSRSSSISEDAGFGIVELPPGKNPTDKAPAAEAGRAAPDFELRTLDGGSLRLSDLQGRPVVVNFWASWCVPCRTETPFLIATYEKYEAQGLVVLGVDLREADAPARGFRDEFEIPYPVVMDRNGQVARTWRIGGPTQGIPASYFIDASGVVRKVVFGPVRTKDMNDGLAAILKAAN